VDAIPGARVETVIGGGHFLSIDQPERVAELIRSFA
jgi:pimeloyl-ACP methyl ester carboxylesterase